MHGFRLRSESIPYLGRVQLCDDAEQGGSDEPNDLGQGTSVRILIFLRSLLQKCDRNDMIKPFFYCLIYICWLKEMSSSDLSSTACSLKKQAKGKKENPYIAASRAAEIGEIKAKDGLPSVDHNNKATLLLIGLFYIIKLSIKDLTPLILKL